MCKWGDTVQRRVLMPANLSHDGKARWTVKEIDRCIAPLVDALNAAGIHTANCCCGHGNRRGEIILHDGRKIIVCSPNTFDEPIPAHSKPKKAD